MSKISEYLEELAAFQAKRAGEMATVSGYAKALQRPVESLLEQLNDAGLKKSATDPLSSAEKDTLLEHLRRPHAQANAERKKITIERRPDHIDHIEAVASQANGAEWDALEEFAINVAFGNKITPNLQHLVNLIVAKSFFAGALPDMRRGRPKSEHAQELGLKIAFLYWEMRDAGKSYSDAVLELSERFHKDERHVMRMVKEHTRAVGETKSHREYWRMAREIYSGSKEDIHNQTLFGWALKDGPTVPDLEAEDFIERIEEQIQAQREALDFLTQKSANLMPVTKSD